MMRSQGILVGSTAVGIVSVLHGDISVSIAYLWGGDWRGGAVLGGMGMRIYRTLILVVLEAHGRLDLSALLVAVLPRRRHLVAIVSPGTASGVLVTLPLIHDSSGGVGGKRERAKKRKSREKGMRK